MEYKGGFVKESLGAPLISNGKAVGIHLAAKDEKECTYGETLGAFLFNVGSPILQHLAPDGINSASSISYAPCQDEVIEPDPIYMPDVYRATIRVIGSSIINNVEVVFQAGEEVILEDGFDSGNNFIAEIVPCIPTVTIISSKPEPEQFIVEQFKINESNIFTNENINIVNVKAYPTVEVNDKITLEIHGLQEFDYTIVSLQGQIISKDKIFNVNESYTEIISIPNMAPGVYFLVLRSNSYSETIKLIKK